MYYDSLIISSIFAQIQKKSLNSLRISPKDQLNESCAILVHFGGTVDFLVPGLVDEKQTAIPCRILNRSSFYFPLSPGWLIGILIWVYYNPYITG